MGASISSSTSGPISSESDVRARCEQLTGFLSNQLSAESAAPEESASTGGRRFDPMLYLDVVWPARIALGALERSLRTSIRVARCRAAFIELTGTGASPPNSTTAPPVAAQTDPFAASHDTGACDDESSSSTRLFSFSRLTVPRLFASDGFVHTRIPTRYLYVLSFPAEFSLFCNFIDDFSSTLSGEGATSGDLSSECFLRYDLITLMRLNICSSLSSIVY